MRGIHIFEKPYYREIRPMRGRAMRGPPVSHFHLCNIHLMKYVRYFLKKYVCDASHTFG